jgi:competence ComEA-like helix-hairpin-helix protein
MDCGKWVIGYLNFTRKDRLGIILLVILILFIFFLPRFYTGSGTTISAPDTVWIARLKELEIKQEKEQKVRIRDTVRRYQPVNQRSGKLTPYSRDSAFTKTRRPAYRHPVIDINTADTTAFIALPGIGSRLAARIVNFREKLGGFYTVQQIAEVYGIADSVFQKIKPYLQLKDPSVRKLNINTATIDELKRHPYIRYQIANAIIAYRNQHGPYSNLEELKKLVLVTEDIYEKMRAYLIL